MTSRQAKKIVKKQMVLCRFHFDGPEKVLTAGVYSYAEGVYQKALRIIHRKMDREMKAPADGSIARLADLMAEQTAARVQVLIRRAA